MIARLVTRCGCSRVIQVPDPPPLEVRLPLHSSFNVVRDEDPALVPSLPIRVFRLRAFGSHSTPAEYVEAEE